MQAGRTVRFEAVNDDGGPMREDDDARLEDLDASQNNTHATSARHVSVQASQMLSALFEGIEADFFNLVSALPPERSSNRLARYHTFRCQSWTAC